MAHATTPEKMVKADVGMVGVGRMGSPCTTTFSSVAFPGSTIENSAKVLKWNTSAETILLVSSTAVGRSSQWDAEWLYQPMR